MSPRADASSLWALEAPCRKASGPGGAWEDLPSRQEEVVSFCPHWLRASVSMLWKFYSSVLTSLVSFPSALQIWVRKTSDSTKMRIYLGQLQRGLFVIRRRSAAWLSPILCFPWPIFRRGILFRFLLTRKCLTWELLLGLGKWRTRWWILQGTFVASHFHLCFTLSCVNFFQPSVAMRLHRSIGSLIDLFLYFLPCVCAF